MNYYNYDLLERLSVLKQKEGFKLKKLNSFIVYDSLNEYLDTTKIMKNEEIKKVCVKIKSNEFNRFIVSNLEYPNYVQFKLMFDYSDNLNVSLDYLNNIDQHLESINNIKEIDIGIYTLYNQKRIQILESILKINSKSIIYSTNYGSDYKEDDNWDHIDSSIVFKSKSKKSKEIEILLDYFEPNNFLSINPKLTSLKSIYLKMNYNDMVNIINGHGSQLTNNFKYPNTLQQDWNEMIQILMNIKSLRNLILNNYCFLHNQFNVRFKQSESKCLTLGFKSLLSNPNCTITTLELTQFNLVDDLFIEGLVENNSITTLIIKSIDISPFIEKVLNKNKIIRNLLYYTGPNNHDYNSDTIFKLFNMMKEEYKLGNYIDLYSITININDLVQNSFNKIIEEVNSNSFAIKEYNIYYKPKHIEPRIKSQTILANGSIINVIKLSS